MKKLEKAVWEVYEGDRKRVASLLSSVCMDADTRLATTKTCFDFGTVEAEKFFWKWFWFDFMAHQPL